MGLGSSIFARWQHVTVGPGERDMLCWAPVVLFVATWWFFCWLATCWFVTNLMCFDIVTYRHHSSKLVSFWENRVLLYFWRQTDRETGKQTNSIDALRSVSLKGIWPPISTTPSRSVTRQLQLNIVRRCKILSKQKKMYRRRYESRRSSKPKLH